jgi:hypothetical protein
VGAMGSQLLAPRADLCSAVGAARMPTAGGWIQRFSPTVWARQTWSRAGLGARRQQVQGLRAVLCHRRLDWIAEMCAKSALPDEGRGTSWASWRTDRLEAGPTFLTRGRTKDQFLR